MPLQKLIKDQLNKFIIDEAKKLGFFDCGISKAEELTDDKIRMEKWLLEAGNGEMSYLDRNKEKRYNPKLLVENSKSVITVLYNYFPKDKLPEKDNFKIAKYAYGTDYHYVIKEKLNSLVKIIETKAGKYNTRVFVDSAPVMDRAWARKSGLGFVGKNTMLINKKGGSFFFIGNIITELELNYSNTEITKDFCGNCTKCIDACPTQAITEFNVDSKKCISYLTIEYRGDLDTKFKQKARNWMFGCDICQDVCPWNRFSTQHNEPLFNPSSDLKAMTKEKWKVLEKIEFNKLFKGSAVNRTRYKGLKRNIDSLT